MVASNESAIGARILPNAFIHISLEHANKVTPDGAFPFVTGLRVTKEDVRDVRTNRAYVAKAANSLARKITTVVGGRKGIKPGTAEEPHQRYRQPCAHE